MQPSSKNALRKSLYAMGCVALTYCLLIVFPDLLFANPIEYREFKVYSHQALGPNLIPLLDQMAAKLERSSLKSPGRVHQIFICDSKREFAFFVPHQRGALSVNYQLGHNIFLGPTDAATNHVGYPENYGSSFTWIATHEIVHSLEQDAIGLRSVMALPFWKREGYAEFIAQESGLDLREGILRLQQDPSPVIVLSATVAIPRQYFEARLLVEYYLLSRKTSFQALAGDAIDQKTLAIEMDHWADNN